MSEEAIMQTNPASRILVYSSSIDTARDFVGRVKALSASKSSALSSGKDKKSEEVELQPTTSSDVISHTLSNKYYTADVHFSLKTMHTLSSEAFHHTNAPPALIFVWTTNESYAEHVQLLSHTMQSMDYEPEVCLGVRISTSDTATAESSAAKDEEITDIDTNLMSFGFEYVDASRERPRALRPQDDSETSDVDLDENGDDVPDLPRVLDALSTIMWSTMRSTQPAQNASADSGSHQLNDEDKAERDALLEELLAAGQEVRSSESVAAKESTSAVKREEDEDEEKLMEQMEAFIKDANALSSYSSYKGFNTDTDFLNTFSPGAGMGSLDSMFDFSAYTGQSSSRAVSRSGSSLSLIDAKTESTDRKSSGKLWLDIGTNTNLPSLTTPLSTHTSVSTPTYGSSQPSTAITASPIDEESLESFGKPSNNLPKITKHAFDDDFTEFVSAPIRPATMTSISADPAQAHLSIPVPSLRRSSSRSSSFTSDFESNDDEHIYAMLDDTSSYGGDDRDREMEEGDVGEIKDESFPNLNEILATTRELFGGQLPVQNRGDNSSVSNSSSRLQQPEREGDAGDYDPKGSEAFDLEGVLGALQRFKTEIGSMSDEEEKKKMAARVALGLVYGLEGQGEPEPSIMAGAKP
ncbi:hypothetical protein CVT24_008027 [Panaeolus cyanescens]|uniref:Uncharacterized protein n=1 Tax=Panaeolus cyanescens TaxID=181874 RepID=A0A409YQY3_9AGAR|nr:hypothetical protein CVT24_008027 [Panaeolus cyanescens]